MAFRVATTAAGLPRPQPGEVTPDDLGRLSELHALLFALDDPTAALPKVLELATKLPPLGPRIVALAQRRIPSRRDLDLRAALSLLGNRGVELVLLELLEDLTILKADLDDASRAAAAARG